MAVTIETLQREFHFGDNTLPDPDPQMTPEEVMGFYSGRYPELTNGFIKEHKEKDGKMVYDISVSVGTKG